MRIVLDLQGCQAIGSRHRGIGRYSMALARAMVREGRGHEFWLLLNAAFADTIEGIEAEFAGLVPPERIARFHVPPESAQAAGKPWNTRAAEAIRAYAIAQLRPDVVHVSSMFEGLGDASVTSVESGHQVLTAVTLYDLIPLLNPERYLSNPLTAAWYRGKVDALARADLLLGISESACHEANTSLPAGHGTVVNISSAVDPGLFFPAPAGGAAERLGLRAGFVMYTGGLDWRKNVEGLVRAYAKLPAPLRAAHQLALVCHAEDHGRTKVLTLARKCGLAPDEVVFTGFVPDADLADLYRSCALFVFPSLHEGFGLPALEAMMCGAVVIGSDRTSIPEVIGRADAMFDPRSDDAIAALMQRALQDEPFRDSLRGSAKEQVTKFSWALTAQRALTAIEQLHQRTQAGAASRSERSAPARPLLAMHAPLPPSQSGIADYTVELAQVLRAHYELELVCDQPDVSLPESLRAVPVRSTAWFREHASRYDRIVYQFGNYLFHAHMFALLRELPGVVVLHDFFLGGVLDWMDTFGVEPGIFSRFLFASHGIEAVDDERANGREAAMAKYPANRPVLQRATGVIVHSRYSVDAAERWYGRGFSRDWRRIAHLRALPPPFDRQAARAELGIGAQDFLVCSFGHITRTKLAERLIHAWTQSSLARDPRCKLVLVGSVRPEYADTVKEALRGNALAGQITITGYADRALYERYLRAADLAVQLRSMTRGETSGAVLDALAFGLPVLANATGSTAEYPPRVIHLLPDEFSDEQLIQALERLRDDPAQRTELSRAGREWIQVHHDPQTIARQYQEAIEHFASDPAHAAYWQAVDAIAAVQPPSDEDLEDAAVALSATTRTG